MFLLSIVNAYNIKFGKLMIKRISLILLSNLNINFTNSMLIVSSSFKMYLGRRKVKLLEIVSNKK